MSTPAKTELPEGAAILVLDRGALEIAVRLRGALPGAAIHARAGRLDQGPEGADHLFTDTVAHLRSLFLAGRPVIGLCATGILIRALAPLIADKRIEPPVIAVQPGEADMPAGNAAVVPLLGGHRGANALARAAAAALGGQAIVTTAGESRLGLALDDPPPGWHIANPEAAKACMAALLADEPVALSVEAGDAAWITESRARFDTTGKRKVLVTDRAVAGDAETLVLHPPALALGVGCERGAATEEMETLIRETLARHGLAAESVACIVSLDLKMDEPAVTALAQSLNVPARFFDADRLEAETPRLANPSDTVFRATGTHGVSEAAALAAVGMDGELVVPKTRSRRATCAVARAAGNIDAAEIGRRRGRLDIVGIGPGDPIWRSPEATAALAGADDIVAYHGYLDLLGDGILAGKSRHGFDLGEEEKRAVFALDRAAEGRAVALACSGDAGIYALAALVFELIEIRAQPGWARIEIAVRPGISALQAAAARAGAPLGHDFCAISLSDLLTPEADIRRRLKAAAEGDFVVALYNPASMRRRALIDEARDIFLGARPATTPVVLARDLGRDDETVNFTTLGELRTAAIDMRTLVIVGSSNTRRLTQAGRQWLYTPRGYNTGNTATGSDAKAEKTAKAQPA